jgi:hypothetical protein
MKHERIRLGNNGEACACKYLESTHFQLYSLGLFNFKTLKCRLVAHVPSVCRYQCEDLDVGGRIILSRVSVTRDEFGLVIGFINHLQVVTTTKYNTVTDFHTTNHSTLIQ